MTLQFRHQHIAINHIRGSIIRTSSIMRLIHFVIAALPGASAAIARGACNAVSTELVSIQLSRQII
jgi:hypothetical protein